MREFRHRAFNPTSECCYVESMRVPADYCDVSRAEPSGEGYRHLYVDGYNECGHEAVHAGRFFAVIHQRTLLSLDRPRSEEHTSELQSHSDLVCRLLLEKK